MTTDPLDGLEQLRRIIDEQPEPAPESVMLGLDYCYAEWVAERARHAEEVSALRDQLRKVEGERDVSRRQCGELHEHLALIVRYFEEETSAGDGIAEQHYAGYQLAKIVLARTAPNEAAWETAMVEFAQLQERASHVPGLSAALDEARHELDARRALDADVRACAEWMRDELIEGHELQTLGCRILAALDSHECPECHRSSDHKMSCSRGGSKGGRLGVSLDSQGGEGE